MAAAEKKITGLLAFPVKGTAKKVGDDESAEGEAPTDASGDKELQLVKNALEAQAEGDTDTAARSLLAAIKRCIANYG